MSTNNRECALKWNCGVKEHAHILFPMPNCPSQKAAWICPPTWSPTLYSSETFGVLSLSLSTPVNLMGERICDSSNESLLELCWPQAGAVSRFEWPSLRGQRWEGQTPRSRGAGAENSPFTGSRGFQSLCLSSGFLGTCSILGGGGVGFISVFQPQQRWAPDSSYLSTHTFQKPLYTEKP